MSGYITINPETGRFEDAKQLAFGGIGAAYAAIGTLTNAPRYFMVNNFTDIDVWISTDGIDDHFPVAAGGAVVLDCATNGIKLPKGTTFYVKQLAGAAATSGSVILSSMYNFVS